MKDDSWMTSRRETLAFASGLASLTTVAGCLDATTSDPATFEASPARVDETALDETGYSFDDVFADVLEREYEVAGQSQDVTVTNKIATYKRLVDMGSLGERPTAVFASLATPQVRVLGQEFNPVEAMSATELAGILEEQYVAIENLRGEETSEVSVNGTTTTSRTFRADAGYEDSLIKLLVHITEAVEMGDDFVVTVGGYPELLVFETEHMRTLMDAIEHDE